MKVGNASDAVFADLGDVGFSKQSPAFAFPEVEDGDVDVTEAEGDEDAAGVREGEAIVAGGDAAIEGGGGGGVGAMDE